MLCSCAVLRRSPAAAAAAAVSGIPPGSIIWQLPPPAPSVSPDGILVRSAALSERGTTSLCERRALEKMSSHF